jgi:hypothetical protein
MADSTIGDARRVKEKVAGIARAAGPIAGVGLTKVGNSYAVKVNLPKSRGIADQLPDSVDGVPVVYEVVGRITARGA